jgi:hypothetical protein
VNLRQPFPQASELVIASRDERAARGSTRWKRALAAKRALGRSGAGWNRSAALDIAAAYTDVAERYWRAWSKVPPGVVGLTLQASDGFSGTNGDPIDGRTMDAAGGGAAHTWNVITAYSTAVSMEINGNTCKSTNNYQWAYDDTMAAVDEGDSEATLDATGDLRNNGPATRMGGTTQYGYEFWPFSGTHQLFKSDTDLLTSAGGSVADNDVMLTSSSGSSHTCKLNGTTVLGPATDSTWATGKLGVAQYRTGSYIDDWVGYYNSAGGAPKFLTLLGVG